jgi:hypothetical protein
MKVLVVLHTDADTSFLGDGRGELQGADGGLLEVEELVMPGVKLVTSGADGGAEAAG